MDEEQNIEISDSDDLSGTEEEDVEMVVSIKLFEQFVHAWLDKHGSDVIQAAITGRKTVKAKNASSVQSQTQTNAQQSSQKQTVVRRNPSKI